VGFGEDDGYLDPEADEGDEPVVIEGPWAG
jgi:hypothetical protein